MNKTSKKCGPSARQQTTTSKARIESSGYSHNRIILSIVLITLGIIATSCRQESHGQDKGYIDKETRALTDSLEKPDVNISVNRRYDDKGNLIGFDSIYSSYHSNIPGSTLRIDSLMRKLDTNFQHYYSQHLEWPYNTLFSRDALHYRWPFRNDLPLKRYDFDDPFLRGMMQRADSIENHFFQHAQKPPEPLKKS